MEVNRSGKMNGPQLSQASFKTHSLLQNRNFSPHHNTNNSKNFNVQNLIEGKSSSGQQNANIFSHAKGADMMLPENNRSLSSPTSTISKASLYNAATKANYPRSNYSYTNALKQAQTHGSQQSLLANVKPQMHENKMWEHNKSQSSKNTEPNLPTITIDDDIDPPLREKVIYKPNLIERKMKHQNPRSPATAGVAANYSKQAHGKNAIPQTQSPGGNFKGADNLRQLQNVKPYNRQYTEQRNGSTSNKAPVEDHPQPKSMSNASPNPHDAKNMGGRGKMPSIRNIPAPFPSVCMPGSSKATTSSQSNVHNSTAPNYSQSSMPPSSQDNGGTHSAQTYSSGELICFFLRIRFKL